SLHCHPRYLPSFPTRRSSDLTSSGAWTQSSSGLVCWLSNLTSAARATVQLTFVGANPGLALLRASVTTDTTDPNRTNNLLSLPIDRKSTRLNSSHVSISYAVF